MNWQYYFFSTILARGRNYYKRRLVINIEKKDNKYHAKVIGTKDYHVSMSILPINILAKKKLQQLSKNGMIEIKINFIDPIDEE